VESQNIVAVVENRKTLWQRYPLSGGLKINTSISGCLSFFSTRRFL